MEAVAVRARRARGVPRGGGEHPTITDTFCHATYLINLATPDRDLYEKSVACLIHNLSVARGMAPRASSCTSARTRELASTTSCARSPRRSSARSTRPIPSPEGVADCPILIENAAGAGGTVGRSLEEIHMMIDATNNDDRLGLCIDTQHLWASGFDYSSDAGAERLVQEIEMSVGIERLRCFHLNDSKIELGGNRDRHANIGEGTIGTRGLATLVGHPLIRDLPLILEVPGSGDGPRAEDVTVARQVVIAGIALYDGDKDWADLLPIDRDRGARAERRQGDERTEEGCGQEGDEEGDEEDGEEGGQALKKTAKKAPQKAAAQEDRQDREEGGDPRE